MNGTFQSFRINDANQAAFHLCQKIAAFQPVAPNPVTLLGETGVGKSHLLRAVVQRIQATSDRGAVAYVTARDFPPAVRALIGNPAPVAKAAQAVLLIDHLDRFNERLEELEAVVRIFLDHGHAVLCASAIHPARLHGLPQGLRALLLGGQLVPIAAAPAGAPGDADTAALLQEAERLLAESERRQQQWLAAEQEREARLREMLERERALSEALPDDQAELKARNEQLDAENAQLKRILTRVRFEREMARILMRRAAEANAAQQHEAAAREEARQLDPESVWSAWEREVDAVVADANRGEPSAEVVARLDGLAEQATAARARLDRLLHRLRRVSGAEDHAGAEDPAEMDADEYEPADAAVHLGEEFVIGQVVEPETSASESILQPDPEHADEGAGRARNVYFFGPPPGEPGMRHVEQFERGFNLEDEAKGGEASA